MRSMRETAVSHASSTGHEPRPDSGQAECPDLYASSHAPPITLTHSPPIAHHPSTLHAHAFHEQPSSVQHLPSHQNRTKHEPRPDNAQTDCPDLCASSHTPYTTLAHSLTIHTKPPTCTPDRERHMRQPAVRHATQTRHERRTQPLKWGLT